ncbi:MAG: potassium channel protein [Bacteroidia bacterium]|nr:potassium channel protein [Bacteroidia bacterium]
MNQFDQQTTKTLRIAIVLIFSVFTFGLVGFHFIEGYGFIDSLYMTVLSVSTVGFEVVRPLSPQGKLFVSFLIIFSLGSFAFVGSSIVRFFLDGEFVKKLKTNKVSKRIEKLTDHVIICGYGRNGEQAALELTDHNQPFVIVERRDNVISRIQEDPNLLFIQGDATNEEVLRTAGIDRARALIATTPNDADNMFVVLTARSLNPDLTIISRASEIGSDSKLRRAGATNVIMPERMGGQRMARLVAQPDVVEFMEYILLQRNRDISIQEVHCRNMAKTNLGKTIGELSLGSVTGTTIIGLKNGDGKYVFNPGGDYKLSFHDQLFVLGSPEQVRNLNNFLEDKM